MNSPTTSFRVHRREGWHTDTAASDLSERQRRVLELLASGRTNFETAEERGVSLEGARYHVREIMAKFGVESREDGREGRVQPNAPQRVSAMYA
jgi:DNA-binding CsgD family transcriptional regulator